MSTDGRSRRWDHHRALRRAELVHEATRAVHRLGPEVSMDEIAQAAGTSKSIFYRYFTDKAGLQGAVGAAVVSRIHTALLAAAGAAPTPRAALAAMVDQYLQMLESSPNVYLFVTRVAEESAGAPVRHFLPAVAALVARPFAAEITGDEREIEAWSTGAVGFVRGVGEWWIGLETAERPDRAAVTERITGWLWTGPVSALARTRVPDADPPGAGPLTSRPARAVAPPGPTATRPENATLVAASGAPALEPEEIR